MALAKELLAQDSIMGTIQAYANHNNTNGGSSPIQVSDPSLESSYAFESYHKLLLKEGEVLENNHLPSLLGLHDTHGTDFIFTAFNSPTEEAHSLVNFKTRSDHCFYTNGSLLSFEQAERVSQSKSYSKIGHEDDYLGWVGIGSRVLEDLNSYETTNGGDGMVKCVGKDNQYVEERYDWLYSAGDSFQDSGLTQGCSNKRPNMGSDVQAAKKHCTSESRKPKTKPTPSKDPQSIAAKNRRERISERLKILQDLVPNGSKVDLVTMLEKAISYVKFLQLQVKVLATDEFWPAQGGKAPEAAQVKEAIEAILSSQRDRNLSSK